MIGANFRGVVDVQDKVEHKERVRPHDHSDAAVVDHFSVVDLQEGVGVSPRRAECVFPFDTVQRGEYCVDWITAEVPRNITFELGKSGKGAGLHGFSPEVNEVSHVHTLFFSGNEIGSAATVQRSSRERDAIFLLRCIVSIFFAEVSVFRSLCCLPLLPIPIVN